MTDAESFYLILAIFYLIECVRFQPPGARAIENAWGLKHGWKPKSEFSRLLGIRKWLFLSPILPWPGRILVIGQDRETNARPKSITAHRVNQLIRLLEKSTQILRGISALVFVYFFLVIPYLYRLQRGEPEFLISIAIGYALIGITAALFFKLHRRWLPHEKGSRIVNTIYTALLPWHSMRCADDLIMGKIKTLDYPTLLAAKKDCPRCLDLLKEYWRKAHFFKTPPYSLAQLKATTQDAHIDTSSWLTPTGINGDKVCPCCFAPYEFSAQFCNDCAEVDLIDNTAMSSPEVRPSVTPESR